MTSESENSLPFGAEDPNSGNLRAWIEAAEPKAVDADTLEALRQGSPAEQALAGAYDGASLEAYFQAMQKSIGHYGLAEGFKQYAAATLRMGEIEGGAFKLRGVCLASLKTRSQSHLGAIRWESLGGHLPHFGPTPFPGLLVGESRPQSPSDKAIPLWCVAFPAVYQARNGHVIGLSRREWLDRAQLLSQEMELSSIQVNVMTDFAEVFVPQQAKLDIVDLFYLNRALVDPRFSPNPWLAVRAAFRWNDKALQEQVRRGCLEYLRPWMPR